MAFTTALLIAGVLFLLIGLLGRIRIKEFEGGSDNTIIRMLLCLLGASLLVAAFLIYRSDKLPQPPEPTPTPAPSPTINNTNTPQPPTPTPTLPLTKADLLIQIITEQQQENVRESYGELAGQNFSDVDLKEFIRNRAAQNIAEQLKSDNRFLDVVLAIKRLSPSERQQLLQRGLNTHKPTWAQLGKVDPKGQTEAGQKAEKMIAEAIVTLVKKLSQLPDEEIRKLYT